MDDWRQQEQELLRRNAELDRKKKEAVEQFETVVRKQEEAYNRYAAAEESFEESLDQPDTLDPAENSKNDTTSTTAADVSTFSSNGVFLTGLKDIKSVVETKKTDRKSSSSGRRAAASRYSSSRRQSSSTARTHTAEVVGQADEKAALDMESALAPGGMSAQATIRLQKARLQALEKALGKLSKENLELNAASKKRSKKTDEMEYDNKQLKRALQKAEAQAAKAKKSFQELRERARGWERELQVAKKKLHEAQKERNQLQTSTKNLDLKLNRALAELDRLKDRLRNQKSSGKAPAEASRKELTKAQTDVRRLQTHNKELIQAFKKQMKLIDVLKRQKMHMEAAKMLSFTEDEFAKTINFKG
mmetsp:Transcript_2071/g.3787  ORF Transcript_2071/g.3787 Transcript_2071/m.3787 type:complete len:361 (-) Transcript_2071:232-1314(-)